MKEISDIINAYSAAVNEGKKMALATVVHVNGSSYRRPGARMLVTDDGQLTGAISGGCLEGDALRKALLAINQQHNKLVTYDTTDEDDAKFGIQLGCNGIVHILFEPIDLDKTTHPIHLLQELSSKRQDGVLITLFSLTQPLDPGPGTCLLVLPDTILSDQTIDQKYCHELLQDANHALLTKESLHQAYQIDNHTWNAFVEYIQPPVALMIAGAGNDAFPLVKIANVLGWQVTIIDGRISHANAQRFPDVDTILVAKPENVLTQLKIDAQTVFVLMTHNYNYDLHLLKLLLQEKSGSYIGSLGPRQKLQRMLDDLKEEGVKISLNMMKRIFGPVGLDLGAETSEEIALSITAEIKKVLNNKSGLSLREKLEPIHDARNGRSIIEL